MSDIHAVAQHGDLIADGGDLVEVVRYVQDRQAAFPQTVDGLQQTVHFAADQRGRRFVEDENVGLTDQFPRDLHDLLLCNA